MMYLLSIVSIPLACSGMKRACPGRSPAYRRRLLGEDMFVLISNDVRGVIEPKDDDGRGALWEKIGKRPEYYTTFRCTCEKSGGAEQKVSTYDQSRGNPKCGIEPAVEGCGSEWEDGKMMNYWKFKGIYWEKHKRDPPSDTVTSTTQNLLKDPRKVKDVKVTPGLPARRLPAPRLPAPRLPASGLTAPRLPAPGLPVPQENPVQRGRARPVMQRLDEGQLMITLQKFYDEYLTKKSIDAEVSALTFFRQDGLTKLFKGFSNRHKKKLLRTSGPWTIEKMRTFLARGTISQYDKTTQLLSEYEKTIFPAFVKFASLNDGYNYGHKFGDSPSPLTEAFVKWYNGKQPELLVYPNQISTLAAFFY